MSKIRARDGSACDGGPACASVTAINQPSIDHDYDLSAIGVRE
jgi:hypothetical protein